MTISLEVTNLTFLRIKKLENKDTVIGNNFDIIDVAKSIAKEKGITSEEVLEAMETAIAKAGRQNMAMNLT